MLPTKPLPTLALTLLLTSLSSLWGQANHALIIDAQPAYLDVLHQGKKVVRYMHAYDPENLIDTYKPYLHVFDAEGQTTITKGPGGDFPHHRAIFIGWNKIHSGGKTFDRWHMKGGSQIHQEFIESEVTAQGARFSSIVLWEGEPNTPLLTEKRSFKIVPASAPFYTIIDLTSELSATHNEVSLDGDPEHAGIQFRPANEVDRSKTVYLFPKENATPTKDLDYPWFAENYTLTNGKSYSVVFLNHPLNPKDARTSAYRDYGRFGTFYKATIKKGESQTFRVRFLISEGALPSAAVIQSAWSQYAGQTAQVPATTTISAAKKK